MDSLTYRRYRAEGERSWRRDGDELLDRVGGNFGNFVVSLFRSGGRMDLRASGCDRLRQNDHDQGTDF